MRFWDRPESDPARQEAPTLPVDIYAFLPVVATLADGITVECPCGKQFGLPFDAQRSLADCPGCGKFGVVGVTFEHPTHNPEPIRVRYSAYGVQLDEVGPDDGGTIVAVGHIPVARFIAAAIHYARTVCGMVNLADDHDASYADQTANVSHRWAIRLPVCPDNDPECPHGRCLSGAERDEDWVIDWDEITSDTPGAFPITLGAW